MAEISAAELMRRGPLWESKQMNVRGCGRRAVRIVPNVTLTPTIPFADLAIEEERPIVLQNSQASLWPALKRWNATGYLARRAPKLLETRTLNVAANVPFGAFVLHDNSVRAARGRQWLSLPREKRADVHLSNMTAAEFLRSSVDSSREAGQRRLHYLTSPLSHWAMDVQRDTEPRHLLEVNDVDADLSGPEHGIKNVGAGAPALEARANTSASLSRAMLWIGHAGVRARLHHDRSHNFFVQVLGQKHFRLYPPSEAVRLHAFPSIHPARRQSQLDAIAVETGDEGASVAFPLYCDSGGAGHEGEMWEAVLSPGDLLYVPPFWWHEVSSLRSKGEGTLANFSASVSVISPSAAEARFAEFYWQAVPLGPSVLNVNEPIERAAGVLALLRLILRALQASHVIVPGLSPPPADRPNIDAKTDISISQDDTGADSFLSLLFRSRFAPLLTQGLREAADDALFDRQNGVLQRCFRAAKLAKGDSSSANNGMYDRVAGAVARKAGNLVRHAVRVFNTTEIAAGARQMLLWDYTEELLRWAVGAQSVGRVLECCATMHDTEY